MLKFGEERMKITLILFVCVIFSSKWSLKNAFLTKKGVKNQNFEKSKKVPLDILEIHVVSKFGPSRLQITADTLSEHIHTHNALFSTLVH